MTTPSISLNMATYTKAQCKAEISLLDAIIDDQCIHPWMTPSLIEMRIIWIERLGALVAEDGGFPGRKFHP